MSNKFKTPLQPRPDQLMDPMAKLRSSERSPRYQQTDHRTCGIKTRKKHPQKEESGLHGGDSRGGGQPAREWSDRDMRRLTPEVRRKLRNPETLQHAEKKQISQLTRARAHQNECNFSRVYGYLPPIHTYPSLFTIEARHLWRQVFYVRKQACAAKVRMVSMFI